MDIFNTLKIGTSDHNVEGGIEKILKFVPTVTEAIVLIVMVFYVFFAFLLTRRLKIMNTNFKTPLAPFFTLLASINLIAALVITLITLLTLIN